MAAQKQWRRRSSGGAEAVAGQKQWQQQQWQQQQQQQQNQVRQQKHWRQQQRCGSIRDAGSSSGGSSSRDAGSGSGSSSTAGRNRRGSLSSLHSSTTMRTQLNGYVCSHMQHKTVVCLWVVVVCGSPACVTGQSQRGLLKLTLGSIPVSASS